jgi:hypothetical protein
MLPTSNHVRATAAHSKTATSLATLVQRSNQGIAVISSRPAGTSTELSSPVPASASASAAAPSVAPSTLPPDADDALKDFQRRCKQIKVS